MGSESEVRISINGVPFCGMHTMMYHCIHFRARFGRSGDGEFDKVEAEGVLSH